MKTITASQAGLHSADLQAFMDKLQKNGLNMHSVLMARSGKLFFEKYWAPFDENMPHRMYSVTKSFVSAAIGCLADDGLLNLDDPIIRYFPDKLPDVVPPELEKQTIRDMLMMCTCFAGGKWFRPEVTDRLKWYFALKPDRPSGTLFHYDSTGSYVLGVLVERLSGMGLLDFLRSRILSHLGGFEQAEILETPDGTPWGDSALLCTPRDLMRFAQFCIQLGRWNGTQLVSESYMRAATAAPPPPDGWTAASFSSTFRSSTDISASWPSPSASVEMTPASAWSRAPRIFWMSTRAGWGQGWSNQEHHRF